MPDDVVQNKEQENIENNEVSPESKTNDVEQKNPENNEEV